MKYIIRNHDKNIFEKQKDDFRRAMNFLKDFYGEDVIHLEITDSYANMRSLIEPHKHIIENVEKAMKEIGLTPKHTPIRGGTDGARLTYMGLPCPNIGTGGYNFHGKYEYISIQSMKNIFKILEKIVYNNVK